jgi:hypothetical protein
LPTAVQGGPESLKRLSQDGGHANLTKNLRASPFKDNLLIDFSQIYSISLAVPLKQFVVQYNGKRGEQRGKIVQGDHLKYYEGLDFRKDTVNHDYLRGMNIQAPTR